MKIEKLTLKEVAISEVDGEYEQVYVNERNYPVFLTNAAMKRGRDMGLIESSLIGELAKMQNLQAVLGEADGNELEGLSELDETQMIQVIYLAFIGANKDKKMDFEEFLELYHNDFTETITLYLKLVTSSLTKDSNFAAAFQKATASPKKKIKSPKFEIECVEDIYTLYCLICGISDEVFWHFPIADVARIYQNKIAYDGWSNNPQER